MGIDGQHAADDAEAAIERWGSGGLLHLRGEGGEIALDEAEQLRGR
ncbi:hypothetical protein [Dankookia rubra]|nr:hypothetical protein [Dankookia rubra]